MEKVQRVVFRRDQAPASSFQLPSPSGVVCTCLFLSAATCENIWSVANREAYPRLGAPSFVLGVDHLA